MQERESMPFNTMLSIQLHRGVHEVNSSSRINAETGSTATGGCNHKYAEQVCLLLITTLIASVHFVQLEHQYPTCKHAKC